MFIENTLLSHSLHNYRSYECFFLNKSINFNKTLTVSEKAIKIFMY